MYRNRRYSLLLLLFVAYMLLFLTACGEKQPAPDGPVVLRIATNTKDPDTISGEPYSMDYELRWRIMDYEKKHENVTIEVEYMPIGIEARELWKQQMRTEVLAGNGPDIFLMCAGTRSSEEGGVHRLVWDNGLFLDPAQAMRGGLFYDISSFYDADKALSTETLDDAVMSAGVMGNARYILPLRYDIPVVCLNQAALDASGLDIEKMAESFSAYCGELAALNDSLWMRRMLPSGIEGAQYAFSVLLDYDKGGIAVSAQEVADYIALRYQMLTLSDGQGRDVDTNIAGYISDGTVIPDGQRLVLYAGGMAEAMELAAAAKAEGRELAMFPLGAMDGKLTASIPWWGAVYANSEHPELAYDVLRMFLMEDSQWELDRPGGRSKDSPSRGLLGEGWPVRSKGAAAHMWQTLLGQAERAFTDKKVKLSADQKQRLAAVLDTTLEDEDMPVLSAEIDIARFPIQEEQEFSLLLNKAFRGELSPEDAARQFIDALQWHLDEG